MWKQFVSKLMCPGHFCGDLKTWELNLFYFTLFSVGKWKKKASQPTFGMECDRQHIWLYHGPDLTCWQNQHEYRLIQLKVVMYHWLHQLLKMHDYRESQTLQKVVLTLQPHSPDLWLLKRLSQLLCQETAHCILCFNTGEVTLYCSCFHLYIVRRLWNTDLIFVTNTLLISSHTQNSALLIKS